MCEPTIESDIDARGRGSSFAAPQVQSPTLGAAASNGCVHIANTVDTYLASIIKPGTLVEIG